MGTVGFKNDRHWQGLQRMGTAYDYDRANDRFLMVGTGEVGDDANSPTINVILNWFEELKQRVPTGR